MEPKTKTIEEQVQEFMDSFDEKLKTEREENQNLTDQKIDDLKKEVKEQMDELIKAIRKNNVNVPGLEDEKEKFSIARACHAIINDEWEKAGFEKEVFTEARKKAVDTNTGGQGGYLIPVELAMDMLIKPAIANAVLKDLGMTVITGLTADVDFPDITSRPTLSWLTDGESVSATDIAHALKKLRPKEGGMLVKVSNRLLMQQSAAEQVVRDLMQEGITDGLDYIGINGTGSDSQPMGILNVTGTNTTNISSARMTIDDAAGMIAAVQEQNFMKNGQGGMLTRPIVISGMKREKVAQYSGDTGGMPFLNPWMSDAVLSDTLGLTIRGTTNVPVASNLTKAVVGDFKEFVMGVWGGVRLKTSDTAGTAFASNQTWIVAFVDVDTMVKHPLAFNIASNVKTNF